MKKRKVGWRRGRWGGEEEGGVEKREVGGEEGGGWGRGRWDGEVKKGWRGVNRGGGVK